MDGRIGSLHVQYRVPSGIPHLHAAIPALDRMCRADLAAACESAFEQSLGADPAVYVLREVSAKLAILSPSSTLTAPIAQAWGSRIAGAALRVLARGDEGIDYVRFDDTADYVARFLADLVRDQARHIWFYGAFSRYLELDRSQAIYQLLEQHRHYLAAILKLLRERGELEAVLSALGPQAAARLSRQDAIPQGVLRESWRPLYMAALGIAHALGADVTEPQAGDFTWFSCLAEDLPSGQTLPDWKDPVRLAGHVQLLLRYLETSGAVRWAQTPSTHSAAGMLENLKSYDWLAIDRVVADLLERHTRPEGKMHLASRSAAAHPTPAQTLFLETLNRLVQQRAAHIEPSSAAFGQNKLRLIAALAAEAPAVASDPQLLAILDAVLQSIQTELAPESGIYLPRTEDLASQQAHRVVEALGPAARELQQSLQAAARSQVRIRPREFTGIRTRSGALFVLTRGVLDLRLHSLLQTLQCDVPAFMAGLAVKLCGELDDGGRLWSGFPDSDPWAALAGLNTNALAKELFHRMLAQRHFQAAQVGIEELSWRDRQLAAVYAGHCWPVAFFAPPSDAHELVSQWTGDFEQAPPPSKSFLDAFGPIANPIDHCPPEIDLALTVAAACVISAWARWLRGISGSTPAYLLKNALNRDAVVNMSSRAVEVIVDPAPLDSIVDMAGYFEAIPQVPWLSNREIRFLR